jgi:SusD/RagB-like outer membrane lipoprotein
MLGRARLALSALAVAGAATLAGCSDYFDDPRAALNPNQPSAAQPNQLFVGVQAFSIANITGDLNRVLSLFTQQMAGTGRQWAGFDQYALTENDFDWAGFYTGGGLVDIRQVEAQVTGDKLYLGIVQTWEALTMDLVSDVWGDIPYSEAIKADVTAPKLDRQVDVHNALLTLMDQAIANLGGAGAGPGSADLIYGGSKTPWLQAAHTLKARMYMHLAETDASAYAKALTETASGISSASNDFVTYQSGTKGEENHWFQFRLQRGTDISAGKYLVDLMKQRNDPRLSDYFTPGASAPNGEIFGAAPGEEDDGTFAWLGPARGQADFRQPVLTYAENQLIRAEAQFKTGAAAAALATLNAYRATVGLPARNGLTGNALLTAIMEEKYVALFQNTEVWNDWKRTCYPNLVPVDGSNYIPARLVYGTLERRANANIPSPSQQPRRNQNDPKTAQSTDGTACRGQG